MIFDAGHGVVVHQQSNPPRQLKNDVVEIFHNAKLKSSNSGMSSKQSKVDADKYEKKPHLPEIVDQISQEVSSPKDTRNHKRQSCDKKNERADDCLQTLNCQNNLE